MPLDLQFYTLFVMVLTGIAAGVVFDVFRVLRGVTGARGVVGDLWDLLFWVVVTLLVAAGLVIGNWGTLRVAVLLGAVLGVWVYTELASELVLAGTRHLLFFIGRAALFTVDLLTAIILGPVELAVLVIQWGVDFIMVIAGGVFGIVAWLFEPVWVSIYPYLESPLGYYRHRFGPYLHLLKQLFR